MALDSWLGKVRSTFSTTFSSTVKPTKPPTNVGILAFEVASLMSKLLHLWRSLSDHNLLRLHRDSISLPGVRKIVSDDDAFLLFLACSEFAESLRLASVSLSVLARRCTDPALRDFARCFAEFSESGRDPHRWVMGWKEMDVKARKMEKYVSATAALYKEMDELLEKELCLKRLVQYSAAAAAKQVQKPPPLTKMATLADVQQKISWQRQEVKHLKETSLWGRSFDSAALLLARAAFTVLARIKQVFHISGQEEPPPPPPSPPSHPRLSFSATVHPSSDMPLVEHLPCEIMEMQTKKEKLGFFEANSTALVPPPTTLGAAGLALRYANIIVVIEKMIKSPRSIGPDARDDLYAMLPGSVRTMLRTRLRAVAGYPATDARLAGEWRTALGKIVEWLSPLAHNTVRWQAERSFERRSAAAAAAAQRSGVLLLQTLHFANREKAEAAVAELLLGLNYVWRFEMEMSAKAAILLMADDCC